MKLSDFELAVMHIIWHDQSLSAPAIHRRISKDRKVSYSTVKTIIDRLEEKGALHRVRNEGRTIIYEATISRDSLSQPMVHNFVRKLFGGNIRPLFNHALSEDNITLDDLAYLESLLAEKKKDIEDSESC